MDLQKILAKIAKGEALSDDEKKFVGEYKTDESRIPKERLDQEISKRKAADEKAAELEGRLAELQKKVEELETSGMSEAEKAKAAAAKELKTLQEQLAKANKEKDETAKKAAELEFSVAVKNIADKHNFTDADYLGYKLQGAGVKLDDETAVGNFMKELEKTAPILFKSSAKPGAGTGGAGGGSAQSSASQRLEELGKKADLSSREVAEVIALQAQVKAEQSAQGNGHQNGGQQQ